MTSIACCLQCRSFIIYLKNTLFYVFSSSLTLILNKLFRRLASPESENLEQIYKEHKGYELRIRVASEIS